ncbi:MAG: hypothetical protein EOO73_18140 [Myxococcales bacterium]|nr:MAG: hypothetical protein EOO73_18140 [Myxococcales bacterium]
MALQPVAWLLAVAAFTPELGADAVDDSMPVRLELTAPSGCSSLRELLAAIQRRNGRVRLASDREPAVALHVILRSEEQGGASGELTVRTKQGESSARSVTGSSCEAVVDALALTAALSLGSYEFSPPPLTAPSGPVPPASSTPVSQPSAARGTADAGAASPSAPARWQWQAGAQASLGQMVAPHLQAGGALLGRARWERQRPLSPSFTLSLGHSRNELFESSRHAGVALTGVSLSGCPVSLWLGTAVRLEPCLTASAAELKASGRDLPAAASVSRSWWGAGALARVSVSAWSGLSLEVEGGALVPLIERRFVVEPSGRSLGSTPDVAPFVTAGLAHAL